MNEAKPERLPTKRETVEILFARGEDVWLHLEPRRPGVVVPESLKAQPRLVLQIGLNMPVPIRDLVVDDEGVNGTLSFDRQPFHCTVPWDAVFTVIGSVGEGGVWTLQEAPTPSKPRGLRRIK